ETERFARKFPEATVQNAVHDLMGPPRCGVGSTSHSFVPLRYTTIGIGFPADPQLSAENLRMVRLFVIWSQQFSPTIRALACVLIGQSVWAVAASADPIQTVFVI